MRDYWANLGANDEYISSQKSYKKFFPSLYYYFFHLLRIVFYSNRQAKKNIYDDINWVNSSIDIVKSLEKTGIKLHVTGLDNIRKASGPVIFISNHMSILETFAFPSFIHQHKKVVYIMKEELTTFPLFGPVSAVRDPIIVGRENPREDLIKVLEQGAEKIKNGKSIIVFPQRTRSRMFVPSSFNTLGIKLAKKNNVPVIPIAIVTDAWGNGKILKDFGKIDPSKEVKFAFGEPIAITSNGNEEHQKVIDFIKNKFIEWGRRDLISE
ncbi:MAG: lysophospholipid acyltransferase family protein [Bacteroidota bacterium]